MSDRSDSNKQIFQLLGEATVTWNDIEHSWLRIFLILLQAPQGNGKIIYNSVISGRTQRSMIGALAKRLLWDHPELCDLTVKLLNETGEKSTWRNGFIHGFYGHSVYIDETTGEAETTPLLIIEGSKNKLLNKDLVTELTRIGGEFNILAHKTWDLYGDISSLPDGALRDKPGPL